MGRIVLFPRGIAFGRQKAWRPGGAKGLRPEVDELLKYEKSGEADDYPRRMAVNVIAFTFIVMLTLAGVWLAETLALLRKNQDCALSGRRNCTLVDMHTTDR